VKPVIYTAGSLTEFWVARPLMLGHWRYASRHGGLTADVSDAKLFWGHQDCLDWCMDKRTEGILNVLPDPVLLPIGTQTDVPWM